MLGRQTLRYGLQVGQADPYRLVDQAFVPVLTVEATGRGDSGRPRRGQLLTVEGAEVSAITREGGVLSVRVFNPSDDPVTVGVGDRQGWLVDLQGQVVGPFEGQFELDPWAIATARLPDQ